MFSMVRNLGGPFGVAILSSVFAGQTADHVRALAKESGPEVGRLQGMAD